MSLAFFDYVDGIPPDVMPTMFRNYQISGLWKQQTTDSGQLKMQRLGVSHNVFLSFLPGRTGGNPRDSMGFGGVINISTYPYSLRLKGAFKITRLKEFLFYVIIYPHFKSLLL